MPSADPSPNRTTAAMAAAASDMAPAPAFRVPVVAVTGLALAAMASSVSMRVTDALLPRLADEFGIALGQAAQVVTTFSIAYGLAQWLFGPLGDRFGKFRVIGWACAVSAAAALLCALASGHSMLLIGRLLAGAAAAAVIPLALAWIGDHVPYEQRQPVLAHFLIGQIVGVALGVWGGGFAAEHLDWRAPFVVVAAFFAATSVILFVLQRRVPGAGRPPPGAAARRGTLIGEFRAVFADRWSRVVLLTVFLEGATLYGGFPFIAAHLHQRLALSLAASGAMLMLFAAGGLVFAFGARRLVALGERRLVSLGAALAAGALVLVAVAPAWGWAVPACLTLGIGFYMMHSTLQTNATQMAPQRRGAAVAAFASCFFVGQAAGVGAAGALVEFVGTGWVLVLAGAGVSATAVLFNRWRVRLQR